MDQLGPWLLFCSSTACTLAVLIIALAGAGQNKQRGITAIILLVLLALTAAIVVIIVNSPIIP